MPAQESDERLRESTGVASGARSSAAKPATVRLTSTVQRRQPRPPHPSDRSSVGAQPCRWLPINHFLEIPDCTIVVRTCWLPLHARLLGLPALLACNPEYDTNPNFAGPIHFEKENDR
jgi:hypothetical protein